MDEMDLEMMTGFTCPCAYMYAEVNELVFYDV